MFAAREEAGSRPGAIRAAIREIRVIVVPPLGPPEPLFPPYGTTARYGASCDSTVALSPTTTSVIASGRM